MNISTRCPDENCKGHTKEPSNDQTDYCCYCGKVLHWYCEKCQTYHSLQYWHHRNKYQDRNNYRGRDCPVDIEKACRLYYQEVYRNRFSLKNILFVGLSFLVLFSTLSLIDRADVLMGILVFGGYCSLCGLLFWKLNNLHEEDEEKFKKGHPQEKILVDRYWQEPMYF